MCVCCLGERSFPFIFSADILGWLICAFMLSKNSCPAELAFFGGRAIMKPTTFQPGMCYMVQSSVGETEQVAGTLHCPFPCLICILVCKKVEKTQIHLQGKSSCSTGIVGRLSKGRGAPSSPAPCLPLCLPPSLQPPGFSCAPTAVYATSMN